MYKNLFIYENDNEIKNIDLKDTFFYKNKIYLIYDAKSIVNPPFFENIYIVNKNLKTDDLKMLTNMLLLNGKIFYPEKYEYFFGTISPFTKNNNSLYIIPSVRVVEFIIMGVQRGGTTALSLNISKHPNIFIDNRKDPRESEVHYFDLNWKRGINWYKNKFNYALSIKF